MSNFYFTDKCVILIKPESYLLCFSVISNGEKILNTKQAQGNIAAINGIRTISTTWVILGHTVAHTVSFTGNTKTFIFKKTSVVCTSFLINSRK